MRSIKLLDWNDQIVEVEIPEDKTVCQIAVTVLSGDETGYIIFTDGTKQWFDAGNGNRFTDYFDGQYVVSAERIEEWNSFEPVKKHSLYAEQRYHKFMKRIGDMK